MKIYNDRFYKNRDEQTRYAANRILSILFEKFSLKSAIDVGCGVGTWLSEFVSLGGDGDILGLDGEYVNRDYLKIPRECFLTKDLEKPINVGCRYDLAICLEVAEHLSEERAHEFIKELCGLSDIVLFSAATIRQGGDGHKNEQRLSYWKRIFELNNYTMLDMIRPVVWNDEGIKWWYRQNTVVFISKKSERMSSKEMEEYMSSIVDIIHPDIYEEIRGHFWAIKNNRYINNIVSIFFSKGKK